MRRVTSILFACVLLVALTSGCDVPKPPPELPTPTRGSGNPESDQARHVTAVPPAVDPGFTPLAAPPGHIYFVRASNLWRTAPDGSGETKLSDLPVNSPPQPSPNGKMVAWVSGQDLYVVPSEGGAARKLASGNLAERQRLGWTPDGAMLGYVTVDPTTMGVEQAWALPVAGGEPTLIATTTRAAVPRGPAYERTVSWSPDGRWVVFSSLSNPIHLFRWPLSTGNPGDARDIGGGEPDWSPDGRTLLYTQSVNGALHLYDVVSSEDIPFRDEQQWVGTGLGEYAQGPGPRWSPASKGASSDPLAYRSRSPEGEPRVSIRLRGARELSPLPSLTNSPAWSPGGDKLVVETGYLEKDVLGSKWVPTGLSIVTIDVENGQHTIAPLVKDAQWPAWGK